MIVAIHQPNFLPWAGYFNKMLKTDFFVFFDHVQINQGRSVTSRNKIANSVGWQWVTVPVKKKGRGLQRICDVEVSTEPKWKAKHLKSLFSNYKSTPFFGEFYPLIENVYLRNHDHLSTFNLELIGVIRKYLGISNVEFLRSSDMELDRQLMSNELLIEVVKGCNGTVYLSGGGDADYLSEDLFAENGLQVIQQNYVPKQYPQGKGEFKPNLSVVDMIFHCGKDALQYI